MLQTYELFQKNTTIIIRFQEIHTICWQACGKQCGLYGPRWQIIRE